MVNPEETAAAVHALARPELGKLSGEEVSQLAGLAVQDLFERWGGKESKNRPDAADIELARLALAAKDTTVLAAAADYAVLAMRKRNRFKEAAKLAGEAIRILDEVRILVPLRLLALASEASQRIGDIEDAKAYIARALEIYSASEEKDIEDYAHALITYSRMLVQSGEPEQALSHLEEAKTILQSDPFLRERAVVLGDIARIYKSRGQVDEALKLHQERLKVFKELGDQSEIAHTLWSLAEIDLQRKSYQTAFDYLSESYAINLKLGRLDGICMVGMYLGPLLCQAGQNKEGLKILERSREGFKKLGWKEDEAQAQELIETFSGTK